MLFSSAVFLFTFLPIVLAIYYIFLRGIRSAQNHFLLVASLFFYGWGEPRFLPVMVLSILMNYLFGRWAYRCRFRKEPVSLPVTVAVACNLALLFVFKYLVFTLESVNSLGLNILVPVIELPIGISFFTFQALSYVLDVAAGRTRAQRSILDLGLYIAFFPQLIAGPIVKYTDVADQLHHRKETWGDFSAGCSRFLIGLGQKVLIANQMAVVVKYVFATDPAALSTPMAWLGSLCYTFQIYYDFSGYSDMAIGLGKMFGFHFLENFDHPYAARTITEFWRRWHISLSTWFRDYAYIPLGGNRVRRKQRIRNLLVVWILTGLWHGANWTFLLWGLFYFLFLYLEKFQHLARGWPSLLQRAYTLLVVNFLWMLFRSDTLEYAWGFLRTMLGFNGTGTADPTCGLFLLENAWVLALALAFSFPLASWLQERLDTFRPKGIDLPLLWDLLYALGLAALGTVCVCYLVKGSYNPFIYFRF